MHHFLRIWMLTLLLMGAGMSGAGLLAAEPTAEEITIREKAFSEMLTSSVLVGRFSVDGKESTDHREERYEIESVEKFSGNIWTFTARIKYGQTDLKIPMNLEVVWAGDTPMISMTDVSIPALGTFTCRVFFYDGRYAGTWQHGEVGGHMWGRIEKAEPGKESNTDETP